MMAMLMVSFGFLMVFVRRYGYGFVTAYLYCGKYRYSFILHVSLREWVFLGEPAELKMDRLIPLAEFCAASILIATGAFLGRLKMSCNILSWH